MKLYMREGTNGPEKLLVDPQAISGKDVPVRSVTSGLRAMAATLFMHLHGGSEKAVLHILDTATARDTAKPSIEPISTTHWMAPRSHSFLYNGCRSCVSCRSGTRNQEPRVSSRHRNQSERDKVVFGYGLSPLVKVEPADIPVVETFPNVRLRLGSDSWFAK